ncbi:uncharacterized protein LOC135483139 [Lineus longissimus]|uniref:uncharacterized protein LOC135483139 n=1 Tax=Lineus longissimus TaxID=88925 RepID=UPI00315CBEA7
MGKAEARTFVNAQIASKKVVVFSKTYCSYCKMAKQALKDVGADFLLLELDNRPDCEDVMDVLKEMTGGRTVPRVFIDGKFVGGGSEMKSMKASGELQKMVKA